MKRILINLYLLLPVLSFGQGLALKSGDQFPDITINQIINSPVKSFNVKSSRDKKFYILNFWGTWCSPCIPEMDELSKLQKANANKLQVIAISDDEPAKLQKYLKNKPTTVWLATDTNYLFYKLFSLASVGQSVIVDADKKITAIMKTHSITQGLLDSLYKGEKIVSDGNIKEMAVNASADLFGVDSTLLANFTLRGYMVGQNSMSRGYGGKSVYAQRRISFLNTGITSLYKAAYNIVSSKQLIYEFDEKTVNNYQDKNSLYCVDLLVKPEEKDSLNLILQKRLNAVLPVKARIEYRTIPVFVITNNGFNLPKSDQVTSYGFSGRGYEGTAVTISDFANDYLSNELSLPVVDETQLKDKYNTKTVLEMRTQAEIFKSINDLRLKIEKQERKMPMLVLYKDMP